MFRLIENKKAVHPFSQERIAVHLYTMEELCYFLETHTYLIDEDWLGEQLFSWLEEELDQKELAGNLRKLFRNTGDVFRCAMEILAASGNYGEQELEKIRILLAAMNGKTAMERRKMRGDLLLEARKYRQAACIYMELLQPDCARQMTEELRGNIMHNLGVVYARLFLFPEAAQMFEDAYKLRKSDETRRAYLYAMNYVEGDNRLDEQEMDLNFTSMKEALNHLTEIADQPDYYVERRKVSQAAEAFDWKTRQEELLARWKEEYREMIL